MNGVTHRHVGGAASPIARDLTLRDGSAAVTTERPMRKVRKRRRKNSAFQSHYGKQRQKECLMLMLFGICLVMLMGMVIYKVAFKNPTVVEMDKEEEIEPPHLRESEKNEKSSSWFGFLSGGKSGGTLEGSMKHIGDKSARYRKLREDYDARYPTDPARSRRAVEMLKLQEFHPKPMMDRSRGIYDIYDCPREPPIGYPYAWNIMDVLENWPPDDPTPRSHIYQGLCVFDYEKDYDKAMHYRLMEKPFVVVNDPSVAKAAERWNSPHYMERLMGDVPHRTEFSENNHFMYWVPPRNNKRKPPTPGNPNGKKRPIQVEKPNNWTQPTKMMRMPYQEWLEHANRTDEYLGPDQPHWYYRLIGCGEQGKCDKDSSEYLFDELTFFQPKQPSLYLKEVEKQKGIHCRFGMKGVIAENHFDGSRNAIVVLGGSRRYILSHPDQCNQLALLPIGHPSGRHSAVDWSDPDLKSYPEFENAKTNEVVLQAGEVLYLPTNWFHYIISLELNFQCNTRSGVGKEYMKAIHDCGF